MSEPVQRVDFFRPPQRPNGGTVYVRPGDEQLPPLPEGDTAGVSSLSAA